MGILITTLSYNCVNLIKEMLTTVRQFFKKQANNLYSDFLHKLKK